MKPKQLVLRRLPKAYIEHDEDGNIFVMNNDECIVAEYFYPVTQSEETAWQYALDALKITQNFNRTHPLRMDLSDFEIKSERITQRMRNGKQKNNKSNQEEFTYNL
jgi:hypothetical protein